MHYAKPSPEARRGEEGEGEKGRGRRGKKEGGGRERGFMLSLTHPKVHIKL